MTEKTLDWLNHNRFRAYPFVNDAGLVSRGSRVPDCVLLDCLVMDTRSLADVPKMVFDEIVVGDDATVVHFTYAGDSYSYSIGRQTSDDSLVRVDGSSVSGPVDELLYMKFVFSSHDYILEHVGKGSWTFSGRILPSKIVSVTASGVMGLSVAGSLNVLGYEGSGVAKGDVHLVDGFRTQPVIQNGKVLVKVGTSYGEDPCHYAGQESSEDTPACDRLMMFFCGQNANTSGNVVLKGGPGVAVQQGRDYTARRDILDTFGNVGIAAGESVPCIEVSASSELLRLYRPSGGQDQPQEQN